MTQELNKTEAEGHILELMRSENVEDVLLGARLAVQVMGKDWCFNVVGRNLGIFRTNYSATYYICKQEKSLFWGIHCTSYLTFLEIEVSTVRSYNHLTLIDITDL